MISSKQRSFLRKLANKEKTILQIGKGGISPALIGQVKEALEARELIKIHVLENSGLDPREACDILARETGSDGVQVVGSRIVLYKQSRDNPRIQLPR